MQRNFYIFTKGRLHRKDGTLYFYDEKEEKKVIPVETVRNIYVFGDLSFNAALFNFITRFGVQLHLFNYIGSYSGSYIPRKSLLSGELIVAQVKTFTSPSKQLPLAKETVAAAAANIRRNVLYYSDIQRGIWHQAKEIENIVKNLEHANNVDEIMGVEGQIRKLYYTMFPLIIRNKDFEFTVRTRQPPETPIDAMISFGNSLVYTTVLTEIYKTQLEPTISFLHKPSNRRFSLALDIAEIFKPILADRLIFRLLNKNMISINDFDTKENACYLNEKGKKTFVKEFDNQLQTIIKHRKLKRNVSYRTIIRLECYKIIKYITKKEKYEAFKIWW